MFVRKFLRNTPIISNDNVSDIGNPADWLLSFFGGRKTSSGIDVSEEKALYTINIFSVINVLAGDIAKLPMALMKEGQKGMKLDRSHPVYPLLTLKANPLMTAYTWKELMMLQFCAWGNAYSWIQCDEWGDPIALWPLDPALTQVYFDPLTGKVTYFAQFTGGKILQLSPDEVIHFKGLTRNGITGMSPVAVAREELGTQIAAAKYLGKFYESGTLTRGVMEAPSELKPDAKREVKREWRELHGGLDNAHDIAILPGPGWKFQNLTMPMEDAQFIETQKWGVRKIAQLYKVPPHKLADLDRATFSNIEHQSLDYVKNTLLPLAENWQLELLVKLFLPKEQKKYRIRFDFKTELRGDSKSRAEVNKMLLEIGALTPNEVRIMEDMEAYEGLGDRAVISLNYTYLDTLEAYQMMKAKGGSKGGDTKNEQGA